jgi:hypothetical protein
MIIDRLKTLFDAINVLFQNKIQNRKDDEMIALVKATTISLYLTLKPKMFEYIQQKDKLGQGDDVSNAIKEMITRIERSISNPSQMNIDDALYYADVINIFCHDYGITKVTYFAGTSTPADRDVYKL